MYEVGASRWRTDGCGQLDDISNDQVKASVDNNGLKLLLRFATWPIRNYMKSNMIAHR